MTDNESVVHVINKQTAKDPKMLRYCAQWSLFA